MHADHPLIALDMAHAHQDAALHAAAYDRLGQLAREGRSSSIERLRRHSGMALVRLGQSLQGPRSRHHSGELAAAAGDLRLAR